MPLNHSMCMTPAEGGGASTLHYMCVDRCELADDRGGASALHHMCVDTCELADDRGRG